MAIVGGGLGAGDAVQLLQRAGRHVDLELAVDRASSAVSLTLSRYESVATIRSSRAEAETEHAGEVRARLVARGRARHPLDRLDERRRGHADRCARQPAREGVGSRPRGRTLSRN